VCACSKPGTGFPTPSVAGFFFMFNELRWEVIVHFVYICVIVEHYNLNKRKKIPKGQSKMDNPEKLATEGTQDEKKQHKNTT
jgi:hypothetical protein